MDPRNPFSNPPPVDDDSTVFQAPKPGGSRAPTPTPAPRPPEPQMPNPRASREPSPAYAPAPAPRGAALGSAPGWAPAPIDFNWQASLAAGSDNPLVNAARVVFAVVGRLRLTTQAPNALVFRNQMMQQVKAFDAALGQARVPQEIALSARYALCSFVDETVMSTPWGSASGWGQQTLLNVWHKEGWGGEKFFTIAQKALADPARFLHLIEFLFLCLCFGFQGRYRVLPQGMAQLAEIHDAMYRAIRTQRGDGERDLAARWQGVQDKRNPLIRYVPLWVVGAVCASLLAAIFLGFRLLLSASADPAAMAVNEMGRDEFKLATRAPAIVVPLGVKRLKTFLEDEIAEGLVTVEETPDRAIVRLKSDQCFASGNALVAPKCLPTLQRVANEVNQVQGRVEVVGHSDNVPLKSLRFASNLALSRARADGVVAAMAGFGVEQARLSADGRADSEPLTDNHSPQGRGLNRRVEIVVFEGAAAMSSLTTPPAVQ